MSSSALFDSDGYKTIKFVRLNPPKVVVKTVAEVTKETTENEESSEVSRSQSSPESSPESSPRTPKLFREPVEEDDSSDVTLFAKYRVFDSGSASTKCIQIEIDSESTVGEMKNAFYEALGIKKPGMKFYHLSYSNGMKFATGDIRKEDGKIGRLLDQFNDLKHIASQNIENGSMFEIDIPK